MVSCLILFFNFIVKIYFIMSLRVVGVILFAFTVVTGGIDVSAQYATAHRIIGGEQLVPNEFPWLVDVVRRGNHFCGGSILTDKWILTGAQCARAAIEEYVVVAGDHDTSVYEGHEQRRSLRRIVLHPNYNQSTFENDIALLELQVPLLMNDFVSDVVRTHPEFEHRGEGIVAGWGSLSEGGVSSTVPYKVAVPLISQPYCENAYAPAGFQILQTMVCAGVTGKDSCFGDSGGPMLCYDDNNGAVFVQCGIVSFGLGCGRPGLPGVYTRLSHFDDWITQQITLSV